MANGKNNSLLQAQKIALELEEKNKGLKGNESQKQNSPSSPSVTPANSAPQVSKEINRIVTGPAELPAPKKKKSSPKKEKSDAKKIKKTIKTKNVLSDKSAEKKTLVDVAKENPSSSLQTVKENTSQTTNYGKFDSSSFEDSIPKSSEGKIEMIGGFVMLLIVLEIIAIIALAVFLLFFR